MDTKKRFTKDGWEEIPIYGVVIAGEPSESYTIEDEYVTIPPELSVKGECFAFRVWGDSMEPDMRDGDIVIALSQHDCETGDIAVAGVNGSRATVKMIYKTATTVTLKPLNKDYSEIEYDKNNITDDIKIMGVVLELRKQYGGSKYAR